MMIHRVALGAVVVALIGLASPVGLKSYGKEKDTKKKDGKDDVVGAIWSYTITRDDKEEKGQFRVYNKEIFKGDKKVGRVEAKDEDETTLYFTDYKEFAGKAVLRKTKTKPAVWSGKLFDKNGPQWEMKVTIKDR